jgi:hypothetical protein
MINIQQTGKHREYWLILALLSGIFFFGFTQRLQAAPADRQAQPVREFQDSRYHHNHNYPTRGQVVRALPNNHREVHHGSSRYYFSGGVWYRPQGARYSIVAPPFGLFVPLLPPSYATVWVSGTPYYYANEVYYARRGEGYVVVEQPQGEVNQQQTSPPLTPPIDQLFIYPRQNQSEQQQATDRFECHGWAVNQTGFDPTQSAGGTFENQAAQKRSDYQRALGACLDGRGYTVR